MLALLVQPAALIAAPDAERTLILQWKTVRGAYGYLLQVAQADGKVEDRRVKSNRAELRLAPGQYRIRLAGLNKFRRPGAWSDWHPMRVTPRATSTGKVARAEVFNLGTADGPAAGRQTPPQGASAATRQAGADSKPVPASSESTARGQGGPPAVDEGASALMRWIPGVPQWRAERKLAGSLIAAGLLASAGYALTEERAAARIARRPGNDPLVAVGLLWSLPSNQLLLPGALLRQDLLSARDSYSVHNRRAEAGLGLAVGFYLWHLLDTWLSSTEASRATGLLGGDALRVSLYVGGPPAASGKTVAPETSTWGVALTARF